ncbi:MAG: hypothetical protein ACP5LD_15165 [Desulfomonilaceae bacterium]
MSGFDRYCTFGMRKQWLHEYLLDPTGIWQSSLLGNKQMTALKVWLRECELFPSDAQKTLLRIVRKLGVDSDLTWAIIWTNLARNSKLISWYIKEVKWGTSFSKQDLVGMMSDGLSLRTHQNAVTALLGLLRDTPLGCSLGLGRFEPSSNRNPKIKKEGWQTPDPRAVMYALYRYAESEKRFNFSLSQLSENGAEGPRTLLGIPSPTLVTCLRGLSSTYPSLIRVEIVKDLDNIFLEPNHDPTSVLAEIAE